MVSSQKIKTPHFVNINSKVGRNINRAIVLNSVRAHQPISRAEIAELTGLSKSTISSIVGNLLIEDLVVEDPGRNQEVGRNPINLQIKKGTHFVGAIAIDVAKTELAIVDLDGTIVRRKDLKTPREDPSEFVRTCVIALNEMKSGIPGSVLKGIGAAVAGRVDARRLNVVDSSIPGWRGVELGKFVRESAPCIDGVAIESLANASTLAELEFGTQRIGSANMVYLLVGDTVEAGFVIDNEILSGSSHVAGDVGHMSIVEGGAPCGCGNRGCWNAYASDAATVARYVEAIKTRPLQATGTTIDDVLAYAENGDAAAMAALTTTAHCIGRGIVNIIKIFDPEVIVVGGSIARSWNLISPHILKTIDERGYWGRQRTTAILPTTLSGSPPLLGAAALSIRKIFSEYATPFAVCTEPAMSEVIDSTWGTEIAKTNPMDN